MSNWITLKNGVHIDLDDPENPVTGSGSFSDLGGGSSKSDFDFSKKATYKAKGENTIRIEGTYNGLVQYQERGASGTWQRWHSKPEALRERLESRGYKEQESKPKINTTVPDVTSKTATEAKRTYSQKTQSLSLDEKTAAAEMLKDYLKKQDEIDAYDHVSTLIDNGTVARFAKKYAKK